MYVLYYYYYMFHENLWYTYYYHIRFYLTYIFVRINIYYIYTYTSTIDSKEHPFRAPPSVHTMLSCFFFFFSTRVLYTKTGACRCCCCACSRRWRRTYVIVQHTAHVMTTATTTTSVHEHNAVYLSVPIRTSTTYIFFRVQKTIIIRSFAPRTPSSSAATNTGPDANAGLPCAIVSPRLSGRSVACSRCEKNISTLQLISLGKNEK